MLRTDLDHLPARKRRELERILAILLEEFEQAQTNRTSGKRRAGRILKIILFGSHARGDFVENHVRGYYSDYDLLIIVNQEELTEKVDYWDKAEDRFLQLNLAKRMKPEVSLIVHNLSDINDQLSRGRYFFMDIVREGIALYEAKGSKLVDPQPLEEDIAREEAQGYFEDWFPLIENARFLAAASIERGVWRDGAFLLHQACERAYQCTLLTLTLYAPASHNIRHLHNRCVDRDQRFLAIWPGGNRLFTRSFERLKDAYVKARYSKHYRISRQELDWLTQRVELLQELVKTVCDERLAALGVVRSS
jgi:uncharacterized protein